MRLNQIESILSTLSGIVNLKYSYPFIVLDVDMSSSLNKVSQDFFTSASFSCHMQGSPLHDRQKKTTEVIG